jgi:superfamily II DNA or RNA helicase
MKKAVFQFDVAHRHTFDYDELLKTEMDNNVIIRRPSQLKSNEKIQDERFGLDWRPTGSGKGYAIRFEVIHNVRKHPTLKVIVACPSILTCKDYLTPMNLSFDGNPKNVVLWNPTNSTTDDDVDSSIQHVIDFLSIDGGDVDSYNTRVMISTHASLVQAFQKNPDAFKNILLIIDEAHHILYDVDENTTEEVDELEKEQNRLGEIIEKAFENPESNIRIHFATATYCRGDKNNIIPKKYHDQFAVYSMPMRDYLEEECKYLKSFSYNFNLYKNSPSESLMEEFSGDGFTKFLGYISHGDPKLKQKKVMEYIQAISQSKTPKVIKHENGTISVWRNGKELIGIDLVEEENRDKKYEYVIDADKWNKPLDFILSLRTFIEGTNWKQFSKLYIIGYVGSVTNILQRIGRALRDCEGKDNVEVVHILPQPFDDKKKNTSEKTLDKYNDYLKTVVLVMEQMPVVFNVSLPKPEQDNHVPPTPNLLMKLLGNNATYDEVVQEFDEQLLNLWATGARDDELKEQFGYCVRDMLIEEYGATEDDVDTIIEDFLHRRETARKRIRNLNQLDLGIDVGDIDLEIVTDTKYVGDLLYLLSNKVDKTFLDKLKEIIRTDWDNMYESVKSDFEVNPN